MIKKLDSMKNSEESSRKSSRRNSVNNSDLTQRLQSRAAALGLLVGRTAARALRRASKSLLRPSVGLGLRSIAVGCVLSGAGVLGGTGFQALSGAPGFSALTTLTTISIPDVYADELGVPDSFIQATLEDTSEYRTTAASLSIGVDPRSGTRADLSESEEYARLRKYRIIFVPGLVTDVTEKAGRLTGGLGLTPADGFLAAFA